MSLGLIGKKIGMTRFFDQEAGSAIPVTVIDVTGNEFVQRKTSDSKDGYNAVQVAYSDNPVTQMGIKEVRDAFSKEELDAIQYDSLEWELEHCADYDVNPDYDRMLEIYTRARREA